MGALLLVHLAGGLGVLALGARLGRSMYAISAVAPAAGVVWLAVHLPGVVDGDVTTESIAWIPSIGLDVDLRLDGFAELMLLLVWGIGLLVVAYSRPYFAAADARAARMLGLLTLFGGAMAGLVVADNLLVLYGFWELTSITSFLLIGDNHTDAKARSAALQALLVTGVGALAMLAGFVILGEAAGTYRLSAILADPPGGAAVTTAIVLILLGAFTKSAQYPFHSWLPKAMVAPTPVSAYLHSATMVKAGVYLVARLAPAFVALDLWRPLVVTVGVVTMAWGGLRAIRQDDLKLLLAYGTIGQLGLMVAVFGWGTPTAMAAGCVVLLAHGAFKGSSFMLTGIVEHQTGTRDVRQLPRPGPGWRPAVATAVAAVASMAGVPLLFGFVAKEAGLAALADQGAGAGAALIGITIGSVLTAAYSARFLAGALGWLATGAPPPAAHSPPASAFLAPAAVLAAAGLLLGIAPGLADDLDSAAARALHRATAGVHLELWHGFTFELLLSAIALVGGVLVFLARDRVAAALAAGDRLIPTPGAYLASLRGVQHVSSRVTAVAQPGSLPVYLGVILLTGAAVPGALLLAGEWWSGWPEFVDLPAHVALAALLLSAALAAAIVRRRFAGALFLGTAGYAMAGLFMVEGAPDLALTQVAIETLTTVLFVLVLRRLPDRFERRTATARRPLRFAVATVVAGLVFAFTLATGSLSPETTVSDEIVARSLPEGHGRNVVNVTLVDFRGFDTLGELTVLASAAIGTVALARAGRRPRGAVIADQDRERAPPPLALARLVTLDVSVRIVFAAVMVGSLWLLFAGHNQPGGGFVGGIVAGGAVALRYVQGGLPAVRRLSRGQPWTILGGGLLVAVTTAIVPLLLGGSVLESAYTQLDVPVLGTVSLTSVLAFDSGVYLAVVGLAMMIFESFGDEVVAEGSQ